MAYKGWSNYETWLTQLWIGGEESASLFWKEQAKDAKNRFELADLLRESITESCVSELSGLSQILMTNSLSKIDWLEIADSMFSSLDNVVDEILDAATK